ncbi:MAG: hypothetical protein GY898_16930 [Proteobacteria bacterium]|nr:hypothetical protein [Pseudomonadota bacterium]
MEAFAVAYAAATLAAFVSVLVYRELRGVWKELSLVDVGVYAGLTVAAVAVSLSYFDAIGNHAWRPHEEQLWWAFEDVAPPDGVWHSLETQVLLRVIYTAVGDLTDRTIRPFVVTAMILGTGGLVFAGVASQLLTRNRWVGYATAAVLVIHPSMAYWRTNAFHIAPPHVAFCATLLCAVLVARKVDFRTCLAWMMCGSLTLFLRMELVGAVVGTAAIPLLCGTRGGVKQWKAWLPALAVAGAFLAWPTMQNLELAAQREDYRAGLRMVPFYLQLHALWLPLSSFGMAALMGMGLFAAAPKSPVDPQLKAAARAMVVLVVVGVLPTIMFMSFGQRHTLASATAGAALAAIGPAALASVPKLAGRGPFIVMAGLLLGAGMVLSSHVVLLDWGDRYAQTEDQKVPLLPGHVRPHGVPEFDARWCAAYASHWQACSAWPNCHPPKDLTDPALVRERWDRHEGCVIWGVDESDGEVAGARHEWWTVASGMYEWESLGIQHYEERGYETEVHIYKLKERP